jgi:hypothetical protein
VRLQCNERDAGGAHQPDRDYLHRDGALDERCADSESKRRCEHCERGHDTETRTMGGGRGMSVDRTDRGRCDDQRAKGTEDVALAAKPLLRARPGSHLARTRRFVHG